MFAPVRVILRFFSNTMPIEAADSNNFQIRERTDPRRPLQRVQKGTSFAGGKKDARAAAKQARGLLGKQKTDLIGRDYLPRDQGLHKNTTTE